MAIEYYSPVDINGVLQVEASSAPNFQLYRSGTGQLWNFSVDSSGRLQLKEAASLGGTKNVRFQIDAAGQVDITSGALTISSDGSNAATFTESGAGHLTIATVDDFVIDAGGQVNIDADGGSIRLKDGGTQFGLFSNSSSDLAISSIVNDKDIIFKGEDGGSTITALTLDMSDGGKATFNNDVVAFSDKKLKDNIETLDGKKVLDMRGVSFTRKDTGLPGSGVIAQEIQKVAPELVNETNGTLGVSYGNLVGYLIEAIKDQQKQIDELKEVCNGCSK